MTDVSFEWFADYVTTMSRQTLTTMGKRVGITPHRRHGAWLFRDADGNDVTLEQVFRALQGNERGQQWLRDVYEAPIRWAEEHRQRQQALEQQLVTEIRATFDFLITAFGYSSSFQIPVRIEDRLILAYRNRRAHRQIEISGTPSGYWTHCEIRRLIDGNPGEYGPHSIAIWELRMMRAFFTNYDEPLDRGETLRDTAKLLR